MTPPPVRPYSAARALVITENSSRLSTIGVYARVLMLTLFSGRITEVPSIVISLEALRPPLIHGIDVPLVGTTPGAIRARLNGLRPLSGSSMIILPPITEDTLEVAVH